MGLFSSITSGILGAKGANKAADRLAEALTSAGVDLETGAKEYEGRLKPVAGIAPEVIQRLQQILLGGDMSKFYESPDFQYRLNRGRDVIEGSAAANKMLMSGRTLKALERFGQNEASSEYGNTLSRLANLFQIAEPSYSTYAGLPYTMASDKANIRTNIGQAMASGIKGKTDSMQGMLANIDDDIMSAASAFSGGFGGGGGISLGAQDFNLPWRR